MSHGNYRRFFDGGIGGWKCPCCGPHNAESKQREGKRIRRKLKRESDESANDRHMNDTGEEK